MDSQLEELRAEALASIAAAVDETAVEQARIKYLGQSGALTAVSKGMKDVAKEDKPRLGKLLNDVRTAVTAALDERKAALLADSDKAAFANIDVTLPGTAARLEDTIVRAGSARARIDSQGPGFLIFSRTFFPALGRSHFRVHLPRLRVS